MPIENKESLLDAQMVVPDLCQVDEAITVLFGKWKPIILLHLLYDGTLRFNVLKKKLPHITHRTLTTQLRELEREGIIQREVYNQVPPKVEYSMTEYGRTLLPILKAMHEWGQRHMRTKQERIEGIDVTGNK